MCTVVRSLINKLRVEMRLGRSRHINVEIVHPVMYKPHASTGERNANRSLQELGQRFLSLLQSASKCDEEAWLKRDVIQSRLVDISKSF